MLTAASRRDEVVSLIFVSLS